MWQREMVRAYSPNAGQQWMRTRMAGAHSGPPRDFILQALDGRRRRLPPEDRGVVGQAVITCVIFLVALCGVIVAASLHPSAMIAIERAASAEVVIPIGS